MHTINPLTAIPTTYRLMRQIDVHFYFRLTFFPRLVCFKVHRLRHVLQHQNLEFSDKRKKAFNL